MKVRVSNSNKKTKEKGFTIIYESYINNEKILLEGL